MDEPVEAMRAFNQFAVDHVLLWSVYPTMPASFTTEIERFQGEVLTMGGPKLEGTHWLSIDRQGAFVQAVRHLTELGHRRIAYAGGKINMEKLYGFMQGVAECRAEYSSDYFLDYYGDSFESDVANLLSNVKRPTAIVVDSQHCLFRLMRVLRQMGVTVSKDMSIVVYDDTPEMETYEIAFTTIGPSIRELAVKAWDIITAERDEDEAGSFVEEAVTASLISRQSARRVEPEQ
ncbi:LacI family transcriptional regulator [Paenibacillus hemerocallicola]|uniref:LacI family transcriptional regulator n=1 Tax=Paenibacillus hemerocallicola TaxID=1172614 RepID=A0A5C4SZF3_9BACL|nr:substrate-binding domain-containing protein [Paenibacillus hemerocallicola]TNJ61875.1 LacI family transcriptional regulator [Paenibacillus hemerocallicola]